MHYAIIAYDFTRNDQWFIDGEIRDRDGIKRWLGHSMPEDVEIVEFDLRDIRSDDTTSSMRRVTEDLVREAYDEGQMERNDPLVVRFLGSPPLTRDEHLANLGDADWHSGEAA